MMKLIASAVVAAGLMAAPANATTFVFKSGLGSFDTPIGDLNVDKDCGSVGTDLCTDNAAGGFRYGKEGVFFTAFGRTAIVYDDVNNTIIDDGDYATLIQDIQPDNSGLGVFSPNEGNRDDQVQFDRGESIIFDFSENANPVAISDIEFNAGADRDCSDPDVKEGPCGFFALFINGVFFDVIEAEDEVAGSFFGEVFEFVALTDGGGFTIAQFTVREVPIPGALPLLLSGIAGLGFAARRKKAA